MQKALKYIQTSLSNLYDKNETHSFYLLIMEQITGLSRSEIILNKEFTLSAEQTEKINAIVTRLKKQEPIQYILGETEFYGLPFLVNEQVLIPRPETEELVEWILTDNTNATAKILDIGTGSGCIPISLAKNLPQAKLSAIDISEQALEIARKNTTLNKVGVDFQLLDILSAKYTKHTAKYDIIVSNPPYVCMQEKQEMQSNVLDYEPHLALFVEDNDPLLFYRTIAQFAQKNLHAKGKLFFEINQAYGKETVELLQKMKFSQVELKKDIAGKDRMIRCIL